MNSKIRIAFYLVFIQLLGSCTHNPGVRTITNKEYKITVRINGQPTEGVTLKTETFELDTDQNGTATIKTRSNTKSLSLQVSYESPDYKFEKLYESVDVKLKKKDKISISFNLKRKPYSEEDLAKLQIEDLNNAENDINELEKETENKLDDLNAVRNSVKRYIRKNPETALRDMEAVFKSFEDLLKALKVDLKKLRIRKLNLEEEIRSGKIINIKSFNTDLLRLRNNLEITLQPYENVLDTTLELMESPLDAEFNIFFGEGEYEVNSLTDAERAKRKDLLNKVSDFIRTQYSGMSPQDLSITIRVTGSADGIPVGETLLAEILDLEECSGINDGNYCLSLLRAKKMGNHLSNRLEGYDVKVETDARGDRDAKNQNANPRLRKVGVSFRIFSNEEQKIITSSNNNN